MLSEEFPWNYCRFKPSVADQLFFYSPKLQMLMPLSEESCCAYLHRPVSICVVTACQDILIGSLYLWPLETSFFNLAVDIILRSPVKMGWWFLLIYFWSNLLQVQGTVSGFSTKDVIFRSLENDFRHCTLNKCVNYLVNIILFNKITTTVNNFLTK